MFGLKKKIVKSAEKSPEAISVINEFAAKLTESLRKENAMIALTTLDGDKLNHSMLFGRLFKKDDMINSLGKWKEQIEDKIEGDKRVEEEKKIISENQKITNPFQKFEKENIDGLNKK
jgi:pyridoxal/pyridoxine/pyridoxamine kinase